ncbi:MAG TPA: alpha/beta hydrolase [Candidatus Dormibacteraeota bacterium]|nr:alpha/beta hydrolase [Candidatus Dormibacteraeota bacterium]
MQTATGRTQRIELADMGISTRVLDVGSGPAVLMFHGNPDNADEWNAVIERLAGRHRCIAMDFPGYGQSPEPPASFSYSIADQMRFVDAVLEAMKVQERVVLVVHDTGGMVGTAWAATNIDRLRGVVVTNTVAFEGFEWFQIARQWGDASPVGRARSALAMASIGLANGALFKRIFGAQCPQLDAEQLDRFARSFAMNHDAKQTTLRQFRQVMRPGFFKDFAAYRKRILDAVPVRVLWGDKDQFIGVRYAHAFGSKQVTILPDAGHWVAITAPAALAAEIEAVTTG